MVVTIANSLHPERIDHAVRLLFGLAFGLLVTAVLFWNMQNLIRTADRTLNEAHSVHLLEFVRVIREEKLPERERIKPPDEVLPPPVGPELPPTIIDHGGPTIIIPPAPVSPHTPVVDKYGSITSGDYLPLVKVAPNYPQRALSKGVEGYCVIQYTVSRGGTIKDPFVVEDQCTSSLFHRASLQAAMKFKYKPRVIDGLAVEVPGVQNKFTFAISD